MIRAFLSNHPVGNFFFTKILLNYFLKDRLAVIKQLFMLIIIQDELQNKLIRRLKSTVQIDGSDQGFQCIRHNRIPVSSARLLLSAAKKNIVLKAERTGTHSQRRLAYKTGTQLGQISLRHLRMHFVEKRAAGKLQHGIPQKFNSLVISPVLETMFIRVGAVAHGIVEQFDILKFIADHFLEVFGFYFFMLLADVSGCMDFLFRILPFHAYL